MEPEGESENLPPPYRSLESTECETETASWGDMDEDDDVDFGYTEKTPSSDPPRGPGGGSTGPPGGGPSGSPGGPHQVDPQEADLRVGEDPLDRADPAEALLEDPLRTPTAHRRRVTRRPLGAGSSTSAGGSRPSSVR